MVSRTASPEPDQAYIQDSPLSTMDNIDHGYFNRGQPSGDEPKQHTSQHASSSSQRDGPRSSDPSGPEPQRPALRSSSQSSSHSSRQRCCSRNHSHVSSHSQQHANHHGDAMSRNHSQSLQQSHASGSRTHSRNTSRNTSYEFKETLDARSRDMGDGSRIINQYRMTSVIGQGSYGTVHRATLADDPSVTFAIKEFGKTRLRKSHRAANMKRSSRGGPRGRSRPRGGFIAAHDSAQQSERSGNQDPKDPLVLIRHEIAILKKLHHPNVVKLYEVLDDPSKDSLYMVFENCPDGPVIEVQPHHQSEPLDEETARSYFIQIMLGMEYLHSNDIVHRDIKPDNILLSDGGRTCKIVDFGVSEMFLKPGDDTMQKSAGSPAFMSPELCTAGHSWYHGRSDDIWSFGVTLYCMAVGRLPFDKDNFFEMYESIKNDEPEYPSHLSDGLRDLLQRMLEKDPEKRISIAQMRKHPWVNRDGAENIISVDENLEQVVVEITEEEIDCAICKITNIFTFARAISKFKKGGSMHRARRAASEAQAQAQKGGDTKDKEQDKGRGKSEDPGAGGSGGGDGGDESNLESKTQALKQELENPDGQQEVLLVDSPASDTVELPPLEEAEDGEGQPKRDAMLRSKSDPAGKAAPMVMSESPELCASPTSELAPSQKGGEEDNLDHADDKGDGKKKADGKTEADGKDQDDDGRHHGLPTPKDEGQEHSQELARRLADVMLQEGGDVNAWKSKDALQSKKKRISILMSSTTGELHASKATRNGSGSGGDYFAPASQGDNRPARKPTQHRPLPKLLDDATVDSPNAENIPTPPGASEAYVAAARDDDLADDPIELDSVRQKMQQEEDE
ncbi:hypothetical protein ACQY0O_003464 [Thecaphora frezii]